MATLSDKTTGMPFAHVNDISMVNFMQKHGTNVPNKIMSSNNDFLLDIDPDTQLSHTIGYEPAGLTVHPPPE